jgi:NitT/TauT family transport system permease protein
VLYGRNPIVAHGLGAYIAESSMNGQFARVLTGVVVMSFYVVVVNRLVWRPLYHLAEVRYSL